MSRPIRGRPRKAPDDKVPAPALAGIEVRDVSQPADGTDFRRPPAPPRPIGTLRDPPKDPAAASRPIGNQARKPEETTKSGVTKLKFLPKLPARHKKEVEDVKPETSASAGRLLSDRGRGRGRGGVGRGELQMTASGPFALGPSALSANRRPTRGLASQGQGLAGPSTGGGLFPTANAGPKRTAVVVADAEQYSDPENEGVEIIDMDQVELMDDMAPMSLKKMKVLRPNRNKVKLPSKSPAPGLDKGKAKAEPDDDSTASLHSSVRPTAEPESSSSEEKDMANALDLSDSDEEEEMEDMLDDFMYSGEANEDADPTRERFYFFQFPAPFPSFITPPSASTAIDVDAPESGPSAPAADHTPDKGKKAVTFAADSKAGTKEKRAVVKPDPDKSPAPKLDGVIGRMELYRDGRIKIVLGDNIAMEVHPAADTAFLENVVHVDPASKQMTSLGPVERRFVVSPDVDALLTQLEVDDKLKKEPSKYEGLVKME